MRVIKAILILLAAVITAVVVSGVGIWFGEHRAIRVDQALLEPFYTAPVPLPPGKPGDIIRSEPLTPAVNLKNANAYRVLYRTELPDGTARVSGAMLFVPTTPAPATGRNIVSWAHMTVGMGDQCAPSRSDDPLSLLGWLQGMLDQGWIVTATDYAGLGTEGPEYYLIGRNEAIDAINAVRMARNFPGTQASKKYGVYGHSQGGHTALWAGAVGPKYAPELDLVGVAGSAPAGNLTALVDQLWNSELQWVIGSEILLSYPAAYPQLHPGQVATKTGLDVYEGIATDCLISGSVASAPGLLLGESAFNSNPMNDPQWAAALSAQNAKPLPPTMPVLVTQSTNDGIVLADSIGAMQEQWCAAGSTLQVDWLGPLTEPWSSQSILSHLLEGEVGGPLATSWFYQRFAGAAPVSNCNTPPLVLPAAPAG